MWWKALVEPEEAGRLVAASPRGFNRFLMALVAAMYAAYGLSMGLFHNGYASVVSAVKLPMLYLLTLLVCFSALYTLNALIGARLSPLACLRLLLLAISTNAVALAGYAPFSLFFTMTTSRDGYTFLVAMHIVVFALAGALSFAQVVRLFRAVARGSQRRVSPAFFLIWGLVYMFVATQMSWVLRPWIGKPTIEYQIIRPLGGSFYEGAWDVGRNVIRKLK